MGTRQHGFTLWELMMAVVVAGIILSLAVPSFQDFQRSNAMAAVANDFVTGALLARSEAVKRQLPVTLCVTDDPTPDAPTCTEASGGAFVVFVDDIGDSVVDVEDTVVLRSAAPGGRIRVWPGNPAVTYEPSGFPRGDSETRFLFCDDRGTAAEPGGRSAARVMILDRTGRGSIRSDIATVETTLAALPDAECGA